jgi:hypothetical protein
MVLALPFDCNRGAALFFDCRHMSAARGRLDAVHLRHGVHSMAITSGNGVWSVLTVILMACCLPACRLAQMKSCKPW